MTKLAILSNINIDPLRNHLQKTDSFELYFAGYNQWQNELLNTESGLYAFLPDFIFIYINAEEFQSDISDLFTSIEAYTEKNKSAYFIVSNFSYPPYSVLTYSSKDSIFESELNNSLNSLASKNDNIFIFDFNRLISFYGYKTLFDDKFWYLGRIKHSHQGFIVLAQELKNVLFCLLGQTKKVLIVDLDNTLWGGVVGEDGWQNIQLSQEGIARVFLDFQKKIKQLQQTGVLLAICSKNNEKEVKEVFEKNNSIQLSWDDFICHEINWNHKPDNIIQIATSLDLGLVSMVFLDDNPVERELVRLSLPEVVVVDFPKDVSVLNQWFVTDVVYPFFGRRKLTKEDTEKTQQYKRNIDRKKIKKHLDYDSFIKQLNVKLTIFHPSIDLCYRIAQLTQKTNQFNLTVKRYSDTEIKAMLGIPNFKIFACEYEDKFGNEGIIGCAIVKIDEKKALIDSFLISCRVLGRRVEFAFLEYIIKELEKDKIKTIEAFYSETSRNGVAKDFYIINGFTSTENNKFIINLE
ncbi:MAG: HAD-IIIC family phosphatase [bacterium]